MDLIKGAALSLLAAIGTASAAAAGETPAASPPIAEGIRWPGEGGKRIVVSVGITIIDFARVSPQDETFEMAGYLDLGWVDPTLALPPERAKTTRRRFRKGDIWSPELEFVNAAEQVQSERDGDLYVDPDGRVVQRVRFSHNFRSSLYLKRFPFDHQTLTISISPFDPFARDIDLVIDRRATGKLPGASVPDWKIEKVSARIDPPSDGNPSDQAFVFEVKVSRRSTFYLWRVFLPLALLVAVSWSVFWIDEEAAPAKFGTAVTVLVSLVAFSYTIDFSLPKVPYLTFADTFSLASFAYVLSVIFAVTAIHVIHKRRGSEAAERLQARARVGFPASFVAVILAVSIYSLA
ncbi:hypothetical protein TA3x_002523 [Tundrisphaera sp. TA3]|uniref:hypothetical protein n=1 Tax=Tundrisphaera sp. TA3 TaxID=3435775 RepID=UPI003EC15098